jgi:hypothetical protein
MRRVYMLKVTVEKKNNLTPLENLVRRAKKLDVQERASLAGLLTPAFLSGCSRFNSADEMFEASGFKIGSQEDFEAIPDAEWDLFIRKNTSFTDWKEMLKAASGEWIKQQLVP